MKKLFLLLILNLIVVSAKSQLYFKNESSKPVYVAYAMQNNSSDNESWYSHGWYSCDPGERIVLSTAVGLNPNVYWFAKTQDGKSEWNGKNRDESSDFLVKSKSFQIKNADMQYVKDKDSSLEWKSFRHISIGVLQLKYTITVTD
jgi:uncharacterized membrane protein